MPQFTNPYNSQNGMMTNTYPNMNSPVSAMPSNYWQSVGNGQTGPMPNQNAQVMQQPNMQNWKTYSPGPHMPQFIGRWVNTFDEITPQDVPMNGSMCFFPQLDGSCIYAMVWSNDGKIVPYRFVPEKNEQQSIPPVPAEMNDILKGYEAISTRVAERLDSVDKRLDDILAATQPKTTTRSKTEKVDKEEK